jgi:hypothetical protein
MTGKPRMLWRSMRVAATLTCALGAVGFSAAVVSTAAAATTPSAINSQSSTTQPDSTAQPDSATQPDSAAQPSAAQADTSAFLGVWNYRTPVPATGLNIAVVSGHGFTEDFPQVGWVDFTRGRDGQVTGRTDQGCTWQFDLRSGKLQLAYPGQKCFNKVIGSEYQMNRWTVSVAGNTEQEYIQATSFLPSGDYSFTLARGGRTRANQGVTAGFAGRWTFNPANPRTGVNMETVISSSGKASEQPVSGSVSFTRKGGVILARTSNGCVWKLNVDGNTAELAATQTCHLADNSSQTYTFWSMAVGGNHEYAAISGSTDTRGTRSAFSLATAQLTRR